MSKRKKPNDARDANFIACFLVHGVMPKGQSPASYTYKVAVREWWAKMNKDMDPPMKCETGYRFWNRYHRWYENMMSNERRTDRAAAHIVEDWIRD